MAAVAPPVTREQVAAVPPLSVVNVLAMSNLRSAHVSNQALVMQFPHTEYNPPVFAALIARLDRAITLLFAGGAAVCPGAASIDDARLGASFFAAMHRRAYMPAVCRDFRIANVVICAYAGFPIDLRAIAEQYATCVSYRPDVFVILQFTVRVDGRSVGISTSFLGSAIVKATTIEAAERAWTWYYTTVLCAHRVDALAGIASSTYNSLKRRANDTFASDVRDIARRVAKRQRRQHVDDADAIESPASVDADTVTLLPTHRCELASVPAFLAAATLDMELERARAAAGKLGALRAFMSAHVREGCVRVTSDEELTAAVHEYVTALAHARAAV